MKVYIVLDKSGNLYGVTSTMRSARDIIQGIIDCLYDTTEDIQDYQEIEFGKGITEIWIDGTEYDILEEEVVE